MPRKRKNGNGGAANRIVSDGGRLGREDDQGHLIVEELTAAQVLIYFFIEKLGKPSLDQIEDRVMAAGVRVTRALLKQAVESLQARGFVSYATTEHPTSGEQVRGYKPRNVMFAAMPEVAHISYNFLASLVASPEATALITDLNVAEHEGDGTAKSRSKLKYADYFEVVARFVTLDRFCGGQVSNQYNDALIKRGPPHPEECDLWLPRDDAGWPVIPVSNARNWIAGILRVAGFSDVVGEYLYLSPTRFDWDAGRTVQYSHPVISDGRGVGLPSYEAIPSGARLEMRIAAPARGLLTPLQFEAALAAFAPRPPRGLSNGKSGEYGRCALVGFEVLGKSDDALVALANAERSVQEVPEAVVYMATLRERIGQVPGRFSLRGGGHVQPE